MTAETKPVDVLRVFDDMASTVQLVSNEHKAWHARIVEAPAAVAELTDATAQLLQHVEFRIDDPRNAMRDRVVMALAIVRGAA